MMLSFIKEDTARREEKSMELITLFLIAMGLLLLLKLKQTFDNPVWKHMPGPSYSVPFFGNAFNIVNSNVSFYHTQWAKQYGPIFRYYAIGRVIVMVTDPALIKHVLLNNHIFDKDLIHYKFIAKALGKGLVTVWDESVHKYHRSIISPAFAHHHMKVLVPIFQRKGGILVEEWQALAGSGNPVDIKEYIARATSDAIGEAAFGYQLNSQRDNSPSSVYHIFGAVISDGLNVLQAVPVLQWLVPSFHKRMAAVRLLDKQVNVIIQQKSEKRAQRVQEEREQRDLLDIMMDCQNEDGAMLTKGELVDQVKTFLMAGYETTSTCLLWTMYLLAKYPHVQEKLAEEVLRVLGKDKIPTSDDIDEMPYMYKVLRESLRYFPPIPQVFRNTSQDVTLGGYFIPKGTAIGVHIYHQHHNSPAWNHPELFDPERWFSDDESNNLLGSYIPFIMGARNCIGSRFAMMEVRIILSLIVQRFQFCLEAGAPEPQTRNKISMVPLNPIRVLLETRV